MSARPFVVSTRPAHRSWGAILGVIFGIGLALAVPAIVSADPGDIGFEHHAGPGGAPTGSKPESKLWFNDGRWWASMYDGNGGDVYIWSLDRAVGRHEAVRRHAQLQRERRGGDGAAPSL
jgi:hypothetical protein